MNPQYNYGCKQNADGNSLFVTRHAPCDRDTTSESEPPPALRDEELSRTHPVSFGEIETTTCNATPVNHRANYAHWKATFRSSLRTWQSSGVMGSGRWRLRFLTVECVTTFWPTLPQGDQVQLTQKQIGTQYPNVEQTHRQTPWRHNSLSATTSVPFGEARQQRAIHESPGTEHAQLKGRLPKLSGNLADLRRQRRAKKLDRWAERTCMRD